MKIEARKDPYYSSLSHSSYPYKIFGSEPFNEWWKVDSLFPLVREEFLSYYLKRRAQNGLL
jgi:hypothetical protein